MSQPRTLTLLESQPIEFRATCTCTRIGTPLQDRVYVREILTLDCPDLPDEDSGTLMSDTRILAKAT
jgi:hypothetical protein